ncbi:MAG: MFS transporter [Chlamydiales bacterium]|nr:MFS transporter [Chlamydiales bacterium]
MKVSFIRRNARFLSGCFGNLFDHYDMALYKCLTPFLAPLFFPEEDPLTALMYAYAIIPLGMIARPVGTVIFSFICDRRGRRHALFLSLMGMGILSCLIGCCPTFQQVGYIAPVILGGTRVLQNLFGAGETLGGSIYILEGVHENKRDLLGSFYGATTMAGILLASLGVSFFCSINAVHQGWRLLYFIGGATALFGLLVRRLDLVQADTPAVKRSLKDCGKLLVQYRRRIVQIAFVNGLGYACYVMALVIPNGLIPLVSGYTNESMSHVSMMMHVFDFAIIPVFGHLASRCSRERIMLLAAVSMVLISMPLFALMPHASFWGMIGIRATLVVIGVAFCAPIHVWSQEGIPIEDRFLVIAFGSALGSRLLGASSAAISLWIYKKTQIVALIPLYWALLAVGVVYILRLKSASAGEGEREGALVDVVKGAANGHAEG